MESIIKNVEVPIEGTKRVGSWKSETKHHKCEVLPLINYFRQNRRSDRTHTSDKIGVRSRTRYHDQDVTWKGITTYLLIYLKDICRKKKLNFKNLKEKTPL